MTEVGVAPKNVERVNYGGPEGQKQHCKQNISQK